MKKHLLSALLAMCLVTTAFAQQGKVYETRTVKSKILGMERSYSIYLPAGYDEGDGSYPVLYLLHGLGDNHTGWVQFGQVQYIADKAIAEGKSAPMIIVMPDADTVHKGYFNLLDGTYNYEDFFFKELIPHIEKTYRVRAESRYRAISGLSMGANGMIGSTVNFMARKFIALRDAFHAGRNSEAFRLQREANEIIETLVEVGVFNAVKYAVQLRGVDCGQCRGPFKPLTDADKRKVKAVLEKNLGEAL